MAIIIPGWQVLVMSGDVFSGLTVGVSGAYLADIVVESGGTVIDTGVSYQGELQLLPGAVAIGTVDSGGTVTVDGAVISDTQVTSGGAIGVASGGEAIDTTIRGSAPILNSGVQATQAIGAGSLAIGTAVLNGGVEVVNSGGVASATTVSSGGGQFVYSGGVAIGTTVSAGGTILDKGVVSGLTILSGATLVLDGDVNASTFSIASGGTLIIGQGYGTWIVGGAYTLSGYTVRAGVTFEVGYGGSAVDTTVSSGGEVVNGGLVVNTTVNSGGMLVQTRPSIATGTRVSNGGTFIIDIGVASGTTVLGGGEEVVSGIVPSGYNGAAVGTTVLSGGEQIIVANGVASGTTVGAGGVQIV